MDKCVLCIYSWKRFKCGICSKCNSYSCFVPIRCCDNCKHNSKKVNEIPCSYCDSKHSNFEWNEE